jgi:long-chain fatty acid transport protein
VRHDTVFYPGTPAAVTTRLDGRVHGEGYIMSAGLTATF